jgi:hypothetical protein
MRTGGSFWKTSGGGDEDNQLFYCASVIGDNVSISSFANPRNWIDPHWFRYQTANYLPSSFAANQTVDVRLHKHVLYVTLPYSDWDVQTDVRVIAKHCKAADQE